MLRYIFCLLLLSLGCSSYPKQKNIKKIKRVVVFYKQKGKTSWYGPGFHGKKMANGKIYDMRKLTAAHKTLPLGTRLKVINLKNKKSVIVMITDRGPYAKGRILDLSKAAFSKIANINDGVIEVYIRRLN